MLAAFGQVVRLRMFSLFLAVIFLFVVTRYILPTTYGTFTLVLSMIQVLTALGLSWANKAILRYGREEYVQHSKLGETLAVRFVFQIGSLCVLVPLVLLGADYAAAHVGSDPFILACIVIAGLVLLPLNEAGMMIAQTIQNFRAYGMVPVIQRSLQLAVAVGLAAGWLHGWTALAAGTLAGYFLGAAYTFFSVIKGNVGRLTIRTDVFKKMFTYSWSLPVITVGALLVAWMDIWFIRYFIDSEAVGIYAWSYTVTTLATSLIIPLAAVLGPRFVDYRLDNNSHRIREAFDVFRSVVLLAAALLPIIIGFLFMVANTVNLGPYAPALAPLLILTVATVLQLAMALMEVVIYAHERLVPVMAGVLLLIVTVNAGGNMVLIPWLGIEGAALSTLFGYAAGVLVQWRVGMAKLNGSSRSVPFAVIAIAAAAVLFSMAAPFYHPLLVMGLGVGSSTLMVGLMRRFGNLGGFDLINVSGRADLYLRWLANVPGKQLAADGGESK
ncbi:MAG: oligosaccharide flippase family protein [Rhodospirillales bacterium]|nr:oligosaccharide flippase family protein [Rhodospirillales bacterium]